LTTVNVVVLAGTVAADPVTRRMPSGERSTGNGCPEHARVDGVLTGLVPGERLSGGGRWAMENEVIEAYERLVSAFREGRDKFGSFAAEATIIDGGRWFGSLAEYRAGWDAWVEKMGHLPVPASVETQVLSLQVLGDTALLVHSIQSREQTDAGEETEREIETIVFARQPDGRWLIVHQHLASLPD
jgi:ketosteroid isomerase-like protein